MTLQTRVLGSHSRQRRCRRSRTTVATLIFMLLVAACGRSGFGIIDSGHEVSSDDAGGDAIDGGGGGPTLVQKTFRSMSSTQTSLTATLPAQTTRGNLLVMIGANIGSALSDVTGGGASWTKASGSDQFANIEIWYGIVTDPSSSNDVMITTRDNPVSFRLHLSEWSGIDTMSTTPILDWSNAQARRPESDGEAFADIMTTHKDLVLFAVSDYDDSAGGGFGKPTEGSWSSMDSITVPDDSIQYSWYQIMQAGTYQPMVPDNTAPQGGQRHWAAVVAAFTATR